MVLLPMVARELRVASRRKLTWRLRSWSAAGAMMSFGYLVFTGTLTQTSSYLGGPSFMLLSTLAFGACLLAGVLLSADSLSAEKREGTLGFLFLTDLKGGDVVLGKFSAVSLNAFYCLLAMLPLLGIPILLGGVTGHEFWRMAMALINALFLSLAAGMLVSALGRDSWRVKGVTICLLLLLTAAIPASAHALAPLRLPASLSYLGWISPSWPFYCAKEMAYRSGPREFWCGLLFSHLLGWSFLFLASVALPRCWQDRPASGQAPINVNSPAGRNSGGAGTREKLRKELLPINSVLWLILRERTCRAQVRVIVSVWTVVVAAICLLQLLFGGSWFAEIESPLSLWIFARPFAFLLKVFCAIQACRFFAEARREGTLEMLFCTPITGKEIVEGQHLALKRVFLRPLLVFLGMLCLPEVVQILMQLPIRPGQPTVEAFDSMFIWFFVSLFACARDFADFYAVGAFGMWLALTMKKPALSAPLTILFVLVLPSLFCPLDGLADLIFFSVAMSHLERGVRQLMAAQYNPPSPGPHPVLAARLSASPPIIH